MAKSSLQAKKMPYALKHNVPALQKKGSLQLVEPGQPFRKWTQHNTTQHNTTQHGTAQHSTAQHSTAQHSTAQHSTAQHSTTRHDTTRHDTTQHNIFYNNCLISRALIGSFLSSIRVQTDIILIYASFQQFNFQLWTVNFLTNGILLTF